MAKIDKEAARSMWAAGKTDAEIARAFGVTKQAVQALRKKYLEPSAPAEAALAEAAEEIPTKDPVQSCADEQPTVETAPEKPEDEEMVESEAKIMTQALELVTARLTGMDAVMTAHVVTTMYNWTGKEDLLMAREALDYLIGRTE